MTVIDILQADGQTEINAVVDVAADVEIVFADVALVRTVKVVGRCRVVEPHIFVLIVVQVASVDVVKLVARYERTVEVWHTLVVCLEKKTIGLLVVGQLVLRRVVQLVGCRKNEVEIPALVVVEREVQKRVSSRAGSIDEAHLVEAHVGFVAFREIGGVLLRDESERDVGRRFAEQSDTSRIRRNGRNVGSERFHRATHTHVASRSVQVVGGNLRIFIRFLRQHRHCCERHCHNHKIFLHSCIYSTLK